MKRLFLNHLLRSIFLMAGIAMLTTGCDSVIYDQEGDCDPVHIIRFNYEMNMKFVDAFPTEVPSVDLHVFDSDGRLVTTVSRTVERDEARDFSIELRGLAPGHYTLLAWCGVKESAHFRVNPDNEPQPALSHHICRINREEDFEAGHVRQDIGRLYHGRLDNVDMTALEGHHEHEVNLVKDTNVVRVVLQHLSGAPMDKDDYTIAITEANGLYDHNNELMADVPLIYHPWSLRGGVASFHPEDRPAAAAANVESRDAQTSVSAVVAEFTVGRLMAERSKKAVLTVHNAHTGELILSIPLIEYMLLVKGYYYTDYGISPMTDQEYLDRQDEYPMTFFLDQNNEWIKTIIYINAWRIVENNSSAH